MAVFGKILVSLPLVFLLVQCKNQPAKPAAAGIPQMSKEDGKIITEREISIWEFSKTKQFDKLREILADDYMGYFSSGNMQPSDAINMLKSTTINSYHLSNIVVKPVSNDVAIIYYDVAQDITGADGAKWIPQVKASSVYARRGEKWYSVFYEEMAGGGN